MGNMLIPLVFENPAPLELLFVTHLIYEGFEYIS